MPLALLAAFTGMIGVSMGIEAFYQRHWWVVMAGITACYGWGLSGGRALAAAGAARRASHPRPRAGPPSTT